MAVPCLLCGKCFSNQSNVNKHRKLVHSLPRQVIQNEKDVSLFKCEPCNASFKYNQEFREHLEKEHVFDIEVEELSYPSYNDFYVWLKNEEKENSVYYKKLTGSKRRKNQPIERIYFKCIRSGKAPKYIGTRKRSEKSQGSRNINKYCTSEIIVRHNVVTGECFVKYFKTHHGHENDIKHLPIPKADRESIASKLIIGIETSKILDTQRSSIGEQLKRSDLLTRKDINNIKRSYNIDQKDGCRDQTDAMKWCMVSGCTNKGYRAGVHYFRVTKERFESWTQVLGKNGTQPLSDNNVVCSSHFKPEDFEIRDNKICLKEDAVPSINLSNKLELRDASKEKKPQKKCAVAFCNSQAAVIHDFPNPATQWKDYLSWLNICKNNQLKTIRPETVTQLYGICDLHLNKKYVMVVGTVPRLLIPVRQYQNKQKVAQQLCRLCYSNGSINLFTWKFEGKILKDIVETVLPIKIKQNDVSTVVCENCKSEVIKFYKFRLKSLQVDKYFQSFNKNESNDINEEKTDDADEEPEVIEIEDDVVNNNDAIQVGSNVSLKEISKEEGVFHLIINETKIYPSVSPLSVNEANTSTNENVKIEEETEDVEENINYVPRDFIESLHNYVKILDKNVSADNVSEETVSAETVSAENTVKEPHRIRRRRRRPRYTHIIRNNVLNKLKNGESVQCIHCNKIIDTVEVFEEHCKTENIAPVFGCDQCKKVFETKVELVRHRQVHKSRLCDRCGKTYSGREQLSSHLKLVHNKNEKKFLCTECPRKFLKNHQLKLHMEFHSKEKSYCCEHCGAVFAASTQLLHHRRLHTAAKPHVCVVCNKAFHNKHRLSGHMVMHTNEKKYSCEKCGVSYKRSLNLRRHNKAHHGNSEEIVEGNIYKCQFCDCSYNSALRLQRHFRQTHKNYTCLVCNTFFDNYKSYFGHIPNCEGRTFTCKKCKTTFDSYSSHYNHKCSYTCSVCNEIFDNYRVHYYHMIKHYPREKKFDCTYCNKKFASRHIRNLHMNAHIGKKEFECNICNKKFSQKPHVKNHMLIHTQEKNYKCKYCTKSFAHLQTLVVHERTHTGETPFVCQFCEKGFGHGTTYKKHVLAKHGVVIPKKRNFQYIQLDDAENEEDGSKTENKNESAVIEDIEEILQTNDIEILS